ncbi:YIP1 family protein [Oleidesulfovibrio sp.]|uniref:YIP1 family protein n=1 Tax=Oleidesulfovibrio sp. TaxID=2909707 RepID=UPI003A8AAA27
MQIRCPECQFTRYVDETKIPPTAALATCPKCRHRFRFRDFALPDEFTLEPDPDQPEAQTVTPSPSPDVTDKAISTRPERGSMPQSGDIWNDIASLGDKKESPQQSIQKAPVDPAESARQTERATETAEVEGATNVQEQRVNAHTVIDNIGSIESKPAPRPTNEVPTVTETAPVEPVQQAEQTAVTESRDAAAPFQPRAEAYTDTEAATPTPAEREERPVAKNDFKDIVDAHHAAKSDPFGAGRTEDSVGHHEPRKNADEYWSDTQTTQEQQEDGSRRIVLEDEPSSIPADLQDRLNRPEPQDIPWEWPDRYGFFPSFIETVKRVLFSPARFFASMRPGLTITAPITFYLLTGIFDEIATRGWFLALARMNHEEIAASPFAGLFNEMVQASGSLSMLLMAILLMVVKLILFSGLYQTFLRLVGADKGGFVTTFRVIAYSNAVGILALFPFFSQIVGPFWYLVLTLIGIKHGHRIGWGKAIFAVLPVYLLMTIFTVMSVQTIMGTIG